MIAFGLALPFSAVLASTPAQADALEFIPEFAGGSIRLTLIEAGRHIDIDCVVIVCGHESRPLCGEPGRAVGTFPEPPPAPGRCPAHRV